MLALAAALALAAPAAVPARAALPEAEFRAAVEAAPARLGLEDVAARLLGARQADALGRWLGWYGALEARPALSTAELAARLRDELASGRADALVLGESHGVPEEEAAAPVLVASALGCGRRVGAFWREENLYPDVSALTAAGVPVATYANQFKPDADVKRALKAARGGIVVSYTGSAHTSVPLKDYFMFALETAAPWHMKDMRTVAQALSDRGRKPVVAAMVCEDFVWGQIQYLFLQALSRPKPRREALIAGLRAVIGAWRTRVEALPARPGPVSFSQDPSSGVWLGITPADRKPYRLLGALKALSSPQAAAWAADAPLTLVESLPSSEGAPDGSVRSFINVILHREGAADLTLTYPVERL